jgi:DNA invertase Pin-like site-specific DNA recombinase
MTSRQTGAKRAKRRIVEPPKARAAVYVRLSKARQGSVSIAKQRAACEGRLDAWGGRYRYSPESYEADGDYFEDNDRGAFQVDSRRPAFDALRDRMVEYRGGVIVFYALDRLVRRLRQWAEIEDLAREFQVDLVAVTQPIDTTDAQGRFFAQMLAQFAQLEAETIGTRVRSAQEHLVQRGRFRGGKPPFGYRVAEHPSGEGFVLEQAPDEARTLRRAYDLIVKQRLTLTRAAETMNQEGFRTRGRTHADGSHTDSPMRGPNLGKWLRNPAVKGEIHFSGGLVQNRDKELVSCISDPILTEAEWARLIRHLNPSTGQSKARDNDLLLSGLVYCARCRHRMRGQTKEWGTYGCFAGSDGSGACAAPAYISRDALEAFVVKWLLAHLDRQAMARGARERASQEDDAVRRSVEAEYARTDAQMSRLMESLADDEYNGSARAQLVTKLNQKAERLAELDAELDLLDEQHRLDLLSAAEPITPDEWEVLELDEKRRLIRMFVERVEVKRSPKGKKSGPRADFTRGRVKIIPTTLRVVAAANE